MKFLVSTDLSKGVAFVKKIILIYVNHFLCVRAYLIWLLNKYRWYLHKNKQMCTIIYTYIYIKVYIVIEQWISQ